MEKEFVPYELAVKLKVLGFDEPCFGWYVDGKLRGVNLGIKELEGIGPYYRRFGFHTLSNHDIDNPNKIVVTAPTFSQAFRWFREKYGLVFNLVGSGPYYPSIALTYVDGDSDIELYEFDTYEEAELACLDKLIEIVENKSE